MSKFDAISLTLRFIDCELDAFDVVYCIWRPLGCAGGTLRVCCSVSVFLCSLFSFLPCLCILRYSVVCSIWSMPVKPEARMSGKFLAEQVYVCLLPPFRCGKLLLSIKSFAIFISSFGCLTMSFWVLFIKIEGLLIGGLLFDDCLLDLKFEFLFATAV